ncbi:MAG: flagellin FliC [Magnetococcales bacterium]|nr:flagellin FliC [Magnetococcales bacterium]
MPLTINTNPTALIIRKQLDKSTIGLNRSLERLATGLRVNRAADDPGSIGVAAKLTSQIRGSAQARRNANDAISLIQVADGALAETANALQRMRELAVQASNSTYTTADRDNLDEEFQELVSEINRLALGTEYNDKVLLMGSFTNHPFQIGTMSGDQISITIASARQSGLGISGGVSVGGSGVEATAAITHVDNALTSVADIRANLGAMQSRLEMIVATLGNTESLLTAARSNIMDADISEETSNLTRNTILQQAGTAVLAQANLSPNMVLTLLNLR